MTLLAWRRVASWRRVAKASKKKEKKVCSSFIGRGKKGGRMPCFDLCFCFHSLLFSFPPVLSFFCRLADPGDKSLFILPKKTKQKNNKQKTYMPALAVLFHLASQCSSTLLLCLFLLSLLFFAGPGDTTVATPSWSNRRCRLSKRRHIVTAERTTHDTER